MTAFIVIPVRTGQAPNKGICKLLLVIKTWLNYIKKPFRKLDSLKGLGVNINSTYVAA
jgi:hypothetical protein